MDHHLISDFRTRDKKNSKETTFVVFVILGRRGINISWASAGHFLLEIWRNEWRQTTYKKCLEKNLIKERKYSVQ